eukprot:m.133387 g.133387  ORF g.133387 m.133387 type:complete len:205 (-) comp20096_c2_seq1:239-853(-)
MESADQRRYFDKFVKKWNEGKLAQKFYDKAVSKDSVQDARTSYQWHFQGAKEKAGAGGDQAPKEAAAGRRPVGPDAPDREELAEYARRLKRKDQKDHRRHNDMVLEELVPKETGRDARVDKRRAFNQGRKDRDASPEVNERDLMGASDFDAELARRKAYRQKKQAAKEERATTKIAEYQEKEKEKMAALMELARQTRADNALWK